MSQTDCKDFLMNTRAVLQVTRHTLEKKMEQWIKGGPLLLQDQHWSKSCSGFKLCVINAPNRLCSLTMQILQLQCMKTSPLQPQSYLIMNYLVRFTRKPFLSFFFTNKMLHICYSDHSKCTERNKILFMWKDNWPRKHTLQKPPSKWRSSQISRVSGPQRPVAQTCFAALPGVWRRERAARPAAWMSIYVIKRKCHPEPRSASLPVLKTVSHPPGDRGAAVLWWEEITVFFSPLGFSLRLNTLIYRPV